MTGISRHVSRPGLGQAAGSPCEPGLRTYNVMQIYTVTRMYNFLFGVIFFQEFSEKSWPTFVSRLERKIEACVAVEVPRTLIADCACASFQSRMC